MKQLINTPARRIGLAVALSILLHLLVIWLPQVELPRFSKLPPLTARLEEIPKERITAKTVRKPKPKTPPKKETPAPPPEPIAIAPVEPVALPASAVAAESAPVATDTPPQVVEKPANRPPLPKQAELRFAVHNGSGGFRIGESLHTLTIENGAYQLKAVTETVGLVSLFKRIRVTQESAGQFDTQGLHPRHYSETREERSGTQSASADFDPATQTATFSHGGSIAFTPEMQDILSMLYQFPPLPMNAETVDTLIGNSKKIERYSFEVAYDETLDTPLGTLHTVHFRKLHRQNEEGLELWIAQEYRFLPVKLRHIDRDGNITAEVVITDIRVADE